MTDEHDDWDDMHCRKCGKYMGKHDIEDSYTVTAYYFTCEDCLK